MPRSLILAAVLISSASAAIWPDKLGDYQRKSAAPVEIAPAARAQAEENGLETIESADYGAFQVTAFRFKDVTGAHAASLDPENKGATRVGNYLVSCASHCPKNFAALADASLPHVSHGALPSLPSYFALKNLVPQSERYILGPIGLATNAPKIPVPAALFDFGTEAEMARFRTPAGQVSLVIFSFATPSLARQQLPKFQEIADAAVKRTGPLIAIAFGPARASEQLLKAIDYQGIVSENEKPPDKPLELKPESAGKMIIAILSLAGLLLAFCLVSGLAVGGSLRLARKFGYSAAEGSLITLHLEGK